MVKYIFITGGVISSVGKGTTAAALGNLFQLRGIKTTILKIDGYLNVDAGLMSPYEHGEVFVTEDGTEADLDLGQYERFLGRDMTKLNSLTSGRVYLDVLMKERKGLYLGKTVQIVPHISNRIREWVEETAAGFDCIIVELGGVAGEVESIPFLEALRQIMLDHRKDTIFIHVALLPFIDWINEAKTKPVQRSVRDLLSHGIQPDMIVCRTAATLSPDVIAKIASFTNVGKDMIVASQNVDWKYRVVQSLFDQRVDEKVLEKLGCLEQFRTIDFSRWANLFSLHDRSTEFPRLNLAFVRKYIVNVDNYVSLLEAINHAALLAHIDLRINFVSAEDEHLEQRLAENDAVLIPGGFGPRGTEGMIAACRYARERDVPFLGICLGFQIAVIEVARTLLKLPKANSTEMDRETDAPVIDQLSKQYEHMRGLKEDFSLSREGIRLGAIPLRLDEGSRLAQIYGATEVSERFRNRYVFNGKYRAAMEEAGARFTAQSNLADTPTAESLEFPGKSFYVAVQFHPEFKSKLFQPHPLISAFLQSALAKKTKGTG